MSDMEAKKERVTRSDLRHDRHTVSLLTDHLVFSPKPFFVKESFTKETQIPHLKEWCPDHLWAPSCYHETHLEKAFTEKRFAIGQGWEVVEKYIEGQKGYSYEKTDTVPVVMIDEEKEKALKPGYITLYTKLFGNVLSFVTHIKHQQFLPCPNVICDALSHARCSSYVLLTLLRFYRQRRINPDQVVVSPDNPDSNISGLLNLLRPWSKLLDRVFIKVMVCGTSPTFCGYRPRILTIS